MTDLDPAAVMDRHINRRHGDDWYCRVCDRADWRERCLTYRLAEALAAAQEDVARLSAYSAAAFDQRDAAQDALAAKDAQ